MADTTQIRTITTPLVVDHGDGTHTPLVSISGGAGTTPLVYTSSVATVGVASAALVAAASRKVLSIQNLDPVGIIYISFTDPATVSDIPIQPGGGWLLNPGPSNALYAIGSQAAIPVAIMSGA
jgi:hypothetical protein